MIPTIISVASFSFQISGAVLLLIWSLCNQDKKIKSMCLEQHSSMLWFDLSGYTVLSKDDVQANAKVVYQNVFAFLNITIGYICAIFVKPIETPALCILGLVALATVVIVILELTLSKVIAKKKYPNDLRVTENDASIKSGAIGLFQTEDDLLNK